MTIPDAEYEGWEREYLALPACQCHAWAEFECGCGNFLDYEKFILEKERDYYRNRYLSDVKLSRHKAP